MNLIDDTNSISNKKKKNTKTLMIVIIILIVLLLFVVIGLTVWMFYLKGTMLKASIDGRQMATIPNDLFIMQNDNTMYVSIKDFATYVGAEAHNGDKSSEDTIKCYVNTGSEEVFYTMASNTLYKNIIGENNNYEYYNIDTEVKMINGKLYSSIEGIKKGFNVQFSYDIEKNQITIFTLPYLVSYYTSQYANSAVSGDTAIFSNQKAILYDMLVVKNKEEKYGVINLATGGEVIGTKYNSITFVESTKDFIVKTDTNKVGILSYDSTTKIKPEYDNVKHIDKNLNLYLVTNNDKKGVINSGGRIILYIEYNEIGIDTSTFSSDLIKNPYLLYDAYIPVMKGQKWGLMDKNGNEIIPIEYDSLGCMGSSTTVGSNNTILVPDYNAIIVSKNSKYGLIDVKGTQILPCAIDAIFSATANGNKTYYMTYQNQTVNLIDFLKSQNVNKNNTNSDTNNTQGTNTVNNTTTNSNVNQNETNQNETNQNETNQNNMIVDQQNENANKNQNTQKQ